MVKLSRTNRPRPLCRYIGQSDRYNPFSSHGRCLMTLAISLSPSAEERLAKKAKAEGIDLPTLAANVLEAEAARLTEEPNPNQSTIDLLKRWDAEDATDDPQELARRQREGEELMRNLAQNRIDSEGPNARKLWP